MRLHAPLRPERAGCDLYAHHDLIGVGEDDLTHQSIEAILSLRAIAGLLVLRLGDGNETSCAYMQAIENRHRPSALYLSPQDIANQANSSIEKVVHRGYIPENARAHQN